MHTNEELIKTWLGSVLKRRKIQTPSLTWVTKYLAENISELIEIEDINLIRILSKTIPYLADQYTPSQNTIDIHTNLQILYEYEESIINILDKMDPERLEFDYMNMARIRGEDHIDPQEDKVLQMETKLNEIFQKDI